MKTIWKFPLTVDDQQAILMPEGAEVLSVDAQDNLPMLWALIPDDAAPLTPRNFRTHGTGHKLLDDGAELTFIGTYMLNQGAFVGHVFEVMT